VARLLIVVALLNSYISARRVLLIDPIGALRVADKGYLTICLPPGTRNQDLIRAIVKGLQAMPRQLQEAKNGPGEGGFAESLSFPRSDCRFGPREALGCETVTREHPKAERIMYGSQNTPRFWPRFRASN